MTTTILYTEYALLPTGWAERVRLHLDPLGIITRIETGASPDGAVSVPAPVIPAMSNLHSQAFLRLMAGRTERRAVGEDAMWRWRNLMYRVIAALDPTLLRAVATDLYIEMLKSGYTAVGEFHTVHHAPDGRPYDQPDEMSLALMAAAQDTGIALTLLPVFYAHGGFGGQSPSDDQKRFLHSIDSYLTLIDRLLPQIWHRQEMRIGLAFHSLRAVTGDEMKKILALADQRLPVHLRISTQAREVAHCLAWSQKHPVDWLMSQLPLNARWCLIHACHATENELRRVAQSGAVLGICPATEANLADGHSDMRSCLQSGGGFGIGSDSQICLSPQEELRWLDYLQRLSFDQRDVLTGDNQPSPGRRLYVEAACGGAQALGQPIGALEVGRRADLLVLDATHPLLDGARGDDILDRFIYAGDRSLIRHVMSAGQWLIRDGQHLNQDAARQYLRQSLQKSGLAESFTLAS